MAYADTITYLLGLEASRGWDLKLERVRDTLARLGSPEGQFPAVLIAGTNGKGSTAVLVENALAAQGHAVGLYTSPHLVHFTERIRLGGQEISREVVVDLVAKIRAAAPPEQTGLTFFEITTVLALLAFAQAGMAVAVLEVGLGGRLDATNVVDPVVSAITSIGLDHQEWLGSSEAEIAIEKAGVFRPQRPTVLANGLSLEARASLERRGGLRRGPAQALGPWRRSSRSSPEHFLSLLLPFSRQLELVFPHPIRSVRVDVLGVRVPLDQAVFNQRLDPPPS